MHTLRTPGLATPSFPTPLEGIGRRPISLNVQPDRFGKRWLVPQLPAFLVSQPLGTKAYKPVADPVWTFPGQK
jgi:hypothetical protein